MFEKQKLKLASVLYRNAFPVYRSLYFRFKSRKDRFRIELIRRLVKPGATAIDIGANIGFFTNLLSACVGPHGHVYSFEPDKTNFLHLKKELSAADNVTLLQKAVASSSGELLLYTSPLLNVDHRTSEPENYKSKYAVEKISIDEFLDGKQKPDLIKMDIQGYEMEALKGMKNTLVNSRDVIIISELWPYGLQRAGSSANEVFDFLINNGFRIYNTDAGNIALLKRQDVEMIKTDFFTDMNIIASRNKLI